MALLLVRENLLNISKIQFPREGVTKWYSSISAGIATSLRTEAAKVS